MNSMNSIKMSNHKCERCNEDKITQLQYKLGFRLCQDCFKQTEDYSKKLKKVKEILSKDNM